MQDENKNKEAWWQPALIMFAKLSVWIAAPVVLASFLGKWLDKKYNTEPWLFLGSVGFAFLVSIIGLVIETKREYGKIEDDKNNRENNK